MYRLIGDVLLLAVITIQLFSCTPRDWPATGSANLVAPARTIRADDSHVRRHQPCLVVLGAFVDRRQRGGELGEINGSPVKDADVAGWLRGAFESELEINENIEVVRMDPAGRGVQIDGEILSVYVVDENDVLIANIVMRLNYLMPDGAFKPGLAFGSTTVNDNGNKEQIREVFEVALSDLVASTRDNIESACMAAKNERSAQREGRSLAGRDSGR